jgi:hypothetical protein
MSDQVISEALREADPARGQVPEGLDNRAEPVTGPVLGIAMKGWYLVSGDVTKDYVEPHVVTNYVSDGQLRSFETTCSVRQFRAWRSAAALLTLLANEKDINADGEVVDRSGRRGIGFSVLSDGGGLPTSGR